MMRWKKIFTTAALLIVVLIVALYLFLSLYDFNKFKPTIAKVVKNATGRELTIAGDIEFVLGIRPTLIVEDVRFQNASWSLTPDLAQIKRMEVQIAILPLIFGKFDFAHLLLKEPAIIVEFDSSGTNNFVFDTASDPGEVSAISPPPLIFSDVLIENGKFTYQDARSDFKFSIRINRLTAEIPGLDKSLELDFEGAFNDAPFKLKGTVGPIWAWVEAGYALPVDITVAAGGATAHVKGEMRNPTQLKQLAFTVTANGASTVDIARLAGLTDIPELGAFKIAVKVADPEGILAVDGLDLHVGSEELVAVSITGNVKNLLNLEGIKLEFTARGKDTANLTKIGIPPPPKRDPFQLSGNITDPGTKVFAVEDLQVILGDNEIKGQVNLNLAEQTPFLTAVLASQKTMLGPAKLDLKLTDLFEKPGIKMLDLKLGTPDLAEIRLNGKIDDLIKLQGVGINFQAQGKNLANLKQLTGKPLPIRGAFNATGKVVIPVHQKVKVPDLKITAGKNNIRCALNLDLSGDHPLLGVELSSPKLDLPSILVPELARQEWVKGLSQVRPVKLSVSLAGFAQEIALKKLDLLAGTVKTAELRLTGSIENLPAQRGIDLSFSLRGNDIAKLHEIAAQRYIFAPVPGQGAYALSGHVSDPIANIYKIENFKFSLAGTELAGRLNLDLASQLPTYEVNLSGPKFNMKPFPLPEKAAYANLNKIDDLGPLKIYSKVVVDGSRLSMPKLDMQAGRDQLISMAVKGSIKNLTEQNGIDLDFSIQGNEIANLKEITDQSLPLKGNYAISGRLTDPAQKNYKLGDLKLSLGENSIAGSLDLNLSAKQLKLATSLAAPKFTLQPVTLPALETISRIEDLGPLKLVLKLIGAGKKLTLENLYFKLGREDLIDIAFKGTIRDLSVMRGVKLDFSAKGNGMSNFEKLGGPDIPYEGAFDISGQFMDPAPKVYRVNSFNAVVGDNNQSGWLELDLSNKRPQLNADLSSEKLDLRPLFNQGEDSNIRNAQPSKTTPQKEKKLQAKTQPSKSGKQKAKVFSAEPLKLEGLQLLDADLKIKNKQVLIPALALNDVILQILLKDGNLEIKPFKFNTGGGKADVQFTLRSQEKPADLLAALNIDQLDIGAMLDELGYQRSVEGNMDAAFNLNGSGDSIAALMAGLNGNVRIAMSQGRAESAYLELLEKYLGSGVLQMLNPFQEKRKYTPINCFVNGIDIKDGLADIKVLLDTDRTSIFGAGKVNLKTEGLDLGIKPTPKKGAGPVGISFSFKELSQPFRLGGTLAAPSLAIDPARTAFVVGKMAGALALGPIGIAAFFADVSAGKKDLCAVAMESAIQKDQSQQSEKAEGSSKESAAGDKNKKDKKSGGFFKRLFGK